MNVELTILADSPVCYASQDTRGDGLRERKHENAEAYRQAAAEFLRADTVNHV